MPKAKYFGRAKQREQRRSSQRAAKYADTYAAFALDQHRDYDLIPLSPSRKAADSSARPVGSKCGRDESCPPHRPSSPPPSPVKSSPALLSMQEKKRHHGPPLRRSELSHSMPCMPFPHPPSPAGTPSSAASISVSSFDVLEEKIILQLYAALFKPHHHHHHVSSAASDGSEKESGDVSSDDNSSGNDVTQAAVDLVWFRRTLKPFLLGRLRSPALAPPTLAAAAIPTVPSFEAFALPQPTTLPSSSSPSSITSPSIVSDAAALLSRHCCRSIAGDLVLRLVSMDHRLYCAPLHLAKSLASRGGPAMRRLLIEALGSVAHHRAQELARREECSLEYELSEDRYIGHDHHVLELLEHIMGSCSLDPDEASALLAALPATLMHMLAANHTALVTEKRELLLSPACVLKNIGALMDLAKTYRSPHPARELLRLLLLLWPTDNADLARAYVAVLETVLLSADSPNDLLPSCTSYPRSLPEPVGSLEKCLDKAVSLCGSINAKLAAACLSMLQRNNILHCFVLPLPISTEGLADHHRRREDRLQRLVTTLRRNRGGHWSSEVRESSGLFLDDLLERLTA